VCPFGGRKLIFADGKNREQTILLEHPLLPAFDKDITVMPSAGLSMVAGSYEQHKMEQGTF